MKTLAIETSCDDTSLSIVSFEDNIFTDIKTLMYSQVASHQQFGGVVPELASRLHSEQIISLLSQLGMSEISDVDFISVTSNPGLPGALLIGKTLGYFLGEFVSKEVVEVNHINGHIFSVFVNRSFDEFAFPMVVLSVSGGHNDIYLINKDIEKSFGFDILKLGQTLDDACGECFDKVSRLLGGEYPGGPWISARASQGKPNKDFEFKRIFLKADELNFSFSGMKSQVYYLLKNLEENNIGLDDSMVNDIAYEFQEAVVEVLAKKIVKAAKLHEAKTIAIVGGVSANQRLWEYTNELANKKIEDIKVFRPVKNLYSTDNACMIGVAGIIKELGNER